ncbi:MAG: hypothetical protein GC192_03315 [Bacteroidetes bacterium]|nr:hypothetical protein [Bacteroidota bacterium]
MVTTLFHSDEPCSIAEQQSQTKSCCKGIACGKVEGEKKHHCSDCTSVFVKLDAKYIPASTLALKSLDLVVPQLMPCPIVEWSTSQKNLQRWHQDLSPPPAGNELLPWIQSYLC